MNPIIRIPITERVALTWENIPKLMSWLGRERFDLECELRRANGRNTQVIYGMSGVLLINPLEEAKVS